MIIGDNLDNNMLSEIQSSGDGLLNVSEELLNRLVHKEPISNVYDVEHTPFARGKFAQVRRASHRATGVQYAAKFIRKRRRAQDTGREIAHEIAVLLKCAASPRVVRLHEVYDTATEMVLVLELAAGGELQRVLDTDECLAEPEARRAMRQILEGLSHLHERNIAHLDLKPQNLLLDTDTSTADIKLCDFGISRVIEPGVEVREIMGTPDYVAPEVLSYEPISLATDIWSVGVLGYVLLTAFSPFGGDSKQQTYLNISQCALSFDPELFHDISSTAINFITSALIIDPRKRPSVKQLLDHPWISTKAPLLPAVPIKTQESITVVAVTPKSTPVLQRKTLSCLPETPRKTFTAEGLNGTSPLRTYNVSPNCLCSPCGTTCRHLPHTPVSKPPGTPITVDRGILC